LEGTPINLSNLEFDLELANNEKNIFRKNAHLLRGIIGGHPFLNGSKRTAVTVVLKIL
jgi:prophage maintenance system killer protein